MQCCSLNVRRRAEQENCQALENVLDFRPLQYFVIDGAYSTRVWERSGSYVSAHIVPEAASTYCIPQIALRRPDICSFAKALLRPASVPRIQKSKFNHPGSPHDLIHSASNRSLLRGGDGQSSYKSFDE